MSPALALFPLSFSLVLMFGCRCASSPANHASREPGTTSYVASNALQGPIVTSRSPPQNQDGLDELQATPSRVVTVPQADYDALLVIARQYGMPSGSTPPILCCPRVVD